MPGLDSDKIKSSWADQMENEEEDYLAERQVEVTGNNKKVTEIRIEDGKKVKVVQYFRTEKRKVSKDVAKRKTWAKFGHSDNDPPGPNNKTTNCCEEVTMEFLGNKEEDTVEKDVSNIMNKMGGGQIGGQVIQCRNCGLNHWTLQCPYKNQLNAINKLNETADPNAKVCSVGLSRLVSIINLLAAGREGKIAAGILLAARR